jgi:hypothetical protein
VPATSQSRGDVPRAREAPPPTSGTSSTMTPQWASRSTRQLRLALRSAGFCRPALKPLLIVAQHWRWPSSATRPLATTAAHSASSTARYWSTYARPWRRQIAAWPESGASRLHSVGSSVRLRFRDQPSVSAAACTHPWRVEAIITRAVARLLEPARSPAPAPMESRTCPACGHAQGRRARPPAPGGHPSTVPAKPPLAWYPACRGLLSRGSAWQEATGPNGTTQPPTSARV